MHSGFLALLKPALGYLAMAALVAGLGFFLVQVFDQQTVLQELTPEPGMTKHCTQNADGSLACSQVPTPPSAPVASPDPDAPMFVTIGVAE